MKKLLPIIDSDRVPSSLRALIKPNIEAWRSILRSQRQIVLQQLIAYGCSMYNREEIQKFLISTDVSSRLSMKERSITMTFNLGRKNSSGASRAAAA